MGKKKGKDKKGKGAEKTAQKTDRNAERKQKKELQRQGEDDIEKLIAEFQEKDKKRAEVTEVKCDPPSPRCNLSFTAHPDREEIILFGGEFFNGKQTYVYNDLYVYHIRSQEWTQITTPNMPPPRCAHQAVSLPQDGGQLWVFGGEFASPSQSQFYHYKELWRFSLRDKTWTKITAPGGPSSRSGHRMVACKKLLLVFGGFHDNIRDYKYYNDIHAFSLDTYTWTKLEVTGSPPAPRSGCMLAVSEDQHRLLVYGGYSKERVKRDVDKGKTHTDMYALCVDSRCKQESAPTKWKWQTVKQSGYRPSPRSGCSLTVVPGNRAVAFGGVFDKEEDDEEVTGEFYNDMYSLELDRSKWYKVNLKGNKDAKQKKKRRKKKEAAAEGDMEAEDEDEDREDEDKDEEDEDMEVEDELEALTVGDQPAPPPGGETVGDQPPGETTEDSDVFTVTVAGSSVPSVGQTDGRDEASMEEVSAPVVPGPRMNTVLAVKHGVLYLYGGVYEVGDKQYTLSDMYALDLHKLNTWTTLRECDLDLQEWQGSEDEESSDEDEEEGATAADDMDTDDDDDDDDDDEEEDEEADEDVPDLDPGQSLDEFFTQHEIFWITRATAMAEAEGLQVSAKQIKKAAFRMAKENHEYQTSEQNS